MRTAGRALLMTCGGLLAYPGSASAQVSPKVEDLVGTWELITTKDMKAGLVTRSTDIEWLQLTRSHWTIIRMNPGRRAVSSAEFAKMPLEAQMKANYALVWGEANQQVFAARGGAYSLVGDRLHHPATMAIHSDLIGVDRVLKINRLDKTTLVAETEYPDNPARRELTYRRID